ncbi:hypothetical protein RchiOBHm_Chr3g0488141 [Rosa chinensis]|uniref:Uncharacterized protein n=1 Tax=Rosa chinensis TaxID=74649 RepID=A0A2P6RFP1_ROSCH|nr:hypothetical protein RchiOBHm_Chr3g0488141 [Rosa chinensis]
MVVCSICAERVSGLFFTTYYIDRICLPLYMPLFPVRFLVRPMVEFNSSRF